MSNLHLAELAARGLSRREKDELIARLTGSKTRTQIISRRRFASMAGRSTRWVDQLTARGIIRKVHIPGSTRAVGFLESEVEALLSGRQTAERVQ